VLRKKNIPVQSTPAPEARPADTRLPTGLVKPAPTGPFETRDDEQPPTIMPNPNAVSFPVYIPKGQTARTVYVSWDDGPTHEYCEIFLSINGTQETEFGRNEQGTKPLTVNLGGKYAFRMVVYSDDKGGNPTTIANLIVTGQSKPENPPAGEGGAGGRRSGRFVVAPGAARDNAIQYFSDVLAQVAPLRDSITFSFKTMEPTEFFIEVSSQRPDARAPIKVAPGERLGAAFPSGAQLAAFTLPGLSGVNTQHRVTVRTAHGLILEPETLYHYVITAKTAAGAYWRHTDKFSIGTHNVKVILEKIRIINDSDPDVGPIRDCGEIKLWFRVNRGQPSFKDLVIGSVNNDNACTGQEYSLNRELVIENAPNALTISVIGKDYDPDFPSLGFPTPFIAQFDEISGPQDRGLEELNVAAGTFDLALIEAGTSGRFTLRSVSPESDRQGDLMFEIVIRVEVSYP
jgi:hypothetical protein